MPAPTATDVADYLGDLADTWDEVTIGKALAAEKASQANRCQVPDDADPWPADLSEALCRRVAANLANRALPLGLQASITDVGAGFARVGGNDAEVQRLEGPYRRLLIG